MLSLKTKNEFLQLINSNYTCLDFLRFVQDNYEAQTIISRYYDEDYVRKLVWFLESHDDCEIESILNTNHTEYYDPDYGSSDPLSGYRIGNKKDVEDFLLQVAEKTPEKIISLYTGPDISLRILFADARDKKVILVKNKFIIVSAILF